MGITVGAIYRDNSHNSSWDTKILDQHSMETRIDDTNISRNIGINITFRNMRIYTMGRNNMGRN